MKPEQCLDLSLLDPSLNDASAINEIAGIIRQGGVIAYPTEAVWGIGCNPWNRSAVYRVLEIKTRPVEKGVILIGCSEDQFAPLLDPLSREDRAKLTGSWPGPHTWVIPDPDGWVPEWVKGQFDSVAVRVSAHPTVQEICRAVGYPIISTSANRAGSEPLLNLSDVEQEFNTALDAIVDGETGPQGIPSQIRDLRSGKIIRP